VQRQVLAPEQQRVPVQPEQSALVQSQRVSWRASSQ
jgi:hypothetical protein